MYLLLERDNRSALISILCWKIHMVLSIHKSCRLVNFEKTWLDRCDRLLNRLMIFNLHLVLHLVVGQRSALILFCLQPNDMF